MSRSRDFEKERKRSLVSKRGSAGPAPRGPRIIPDGLAEQRGWTRPPVREWRREDWSKSPRDS